LRTRVRPDEGAGKSISNKTLDDPDHQLDVIMAIRITRDVCTTQRSVAFTAEIVLAMGRKLLGDPGQHEHAEGELTVEEAIAELEAGASALERARARGLRAAGRCGAGGGHGAGQLEGRPAWKRGPAHKISRGAFVS
jgi:hypothetical protein